MNENRMNTAERDELQQTARRILAERAPIERVRSLLDDDLGHDSQLHRDMLDLGWSAMHLPEPFGGFGASFADTSVVVSELGRALTGGPLMPSAVVAAGALVLAPNRALCASILPALIDGSSLATVAIAGASGHFGEKSLGVRWQAGRRGSMTLDGVATFVQEASLADRFVVFAGNERGVIAAVVERSQPGISVEPVRALDQTRRLASVTFDHVEVGVESLLAESTDGGALLRSVVDIGATVMALDSFGLAEVVVERTADYVKQRFQFGRSIGSFQAIKHRLADAVLLVETSRVAAYSAAAAVDMCGPSMSVRDRVVAVATAKAYVCDAAVKICGDSLQSHGGIGFTWEHDTHLYLKRAMLNQALFGTSSWHRRRVADEVLPAITRTV